MQSVFRVLAYMGTQFQTMYIKAESVGEACRYAVKALGAVSADYDPDNYDKGQFHPYDVEAQS